MTYHYKYWSAFNEADLLNAGDHSIGIGDTFTMPGAATVTLASYDNDGQLSGDYNDKATDSDGHYDQYGWANNGSGWQKTGDLYVEKVYTLTGSDGKTYYLAEIEGENKAENEDYFSFVGATPPAGVTLTINSCSNSHGVNYSDLSADPSQPPANVAPVFDNLPDNGVIHLDENNAHVIDIDASDADGDTLTYAITGGVDGHLFIIDPATGDLCFRTDPDFENPHDSNGNNVYDVTITVTDGNGGTATKPLWIKIKDVDEHVNTAPVFDNLPANGVICVDENNTFVIDVDASDIDGDNLTYAITGGADAGDFSIDPHTGELTFNVAPDFENPHDASGHNNVYDVTVTVSDGNGGEFTKPLWIKVKDVDENTGGNCIVIEAEHMNKYKFNTVHGDQASGGELVRLNCAGGNGDLSTTFQGETGTYDLTVFAQDESDGQSTIMVKVNGHVVGTITLDGDNNGVGSNNGAFSEFTLEDIQIGKGDVVQLWAQSEGGEFVRIDKIELCQDGEVCDAKLDFEGLGRGTVVNDQFAGVTITAQRDDNNTAANDAMIFDSDNPTGGDHDLGYSGRGNILIISEDNDSSDPDDAVGGTITFDFDNPSDLKDIVLLDIEENGGTIVLTKADGSTQTVAIPAAGNNSAQTIDLNATDVVTMEINLAGSGAVDDLCWTPGEAPVLGSIGGTYFMDNNDNSVQDAGDMGLEGQTVWLVEVGVGIVAQTTTDADGNYLFEGLEAGDYSVRFDGNNVGGKTLVDSNVGNDDTIDSDIDFTGTSGNHNTAVISLGEGDDVRNVDAGVEDPGTASLGGRIFHDSDDDSQDNGNGNEDPAPGVTVRLLDADGNELATTTTNANGEYLFENLKAGDYKVDFPTEVDGKVLVEQNVGNDLSDSDADQTTGETGVVSVGLGEDVRDVDAGVEDPGTAAINGRLFMDSDDDSQDNGEMGVSGIEVELLDDEGNVIATTTTNGNGDYTFGGLGAGDYSVRFPTEVDGKVLVEQNVGPDATDSDADQGTGETGTISLEIGDVSNDNDAGVEDPGTASLAGKVFMDNNDNDQNDAGDMAIGGVAVELLDVDGDVVRETTTAADGSYEFTGLDAGSYSVRFPTTVDGKVLVDSNVGDDTSDSDANTGDGETPVVELGIGERSENNDAGFEDPGTASVAGRYFMDMNDNSRDDGEPGVPGATVWLIKAGEGIVASMTTDDNGEYLFEGLEAGSYRVRFEDPTDVDGQNGKVFVDANVGDDIDDSDAEVDDSDVTIVGSAGNGNTAFFPVEIGDAITNVDAGIEDPGTAAIGDRVFFDENGNGQQDGGETGVGGVGVIVRDADGNIVGTDTTDANGDYLVDGLDAGTYTVEFEEVDGFDFTTANQGNDASDSDADQTTGVTGAVTLDIGETDLTVDAGLVAENTDPEAGDDEGMVCATEAVTINVLDNDTDADGDTVSVAHVNGEELSAGDSTTLDSGAVVTLNADGTLSYDSADAVIGGQPVTELLIGDTAMDSFTYSITDGNGGTDTGEVSVTLKGGFNTVETIATNLPTSGNVTFSGHNVGTAYSATLSGTGDALLDGLVIEAAYCIERSEDYFSNRDVTVDITAGADSLNDPNAFSSDVIGNLDLINWILNQDFTSQSNGDTTGNGAGRNYTDAEIQAAIWGITDGDSSLQGSETVGPFYNGTQANAEEIIALAQANGEGFEPGEGDLFALVLNPTDTQAGFGESNDFDQAFIVAVSFDDYKEECIC